MGFMLVKEKTGVTPYVMINEDKHYMKFEGKSFSEDASEFYGDVVNWLEKYLSADFRTFTFDCNLIYFNSSTAKVLYNMLRNMDKVSSGSNKITVNWMADSKNAIAVEFAEEFMEEMENLDFNMILS